MLVVKLVLDKFVDVTLPAVNEVELLIAFCFELNVVQSADESAPRFSADAVGSSRVVTPDVVLTVKSVPVVPGTIVCAAVVSPLIDVTAAVKAPLMLDADKVVGTHAVPLYSRT